MSTSETPRRLGRRRRNDYGYDRRDRRALPRRRATLAAALIVAGGLGHQITADASSVETAGEGVLRFGLSDVVATLDPYASFDCPVQTGTAPIFNALLRYVDGELVGDLASSWEYVDPTTLRVELVDGVLFHDGSSFDADDVVASFDRATQEESIGFDRSMVAVVDEVVTVDPLTVEFRLSAPSAYLTAALPHLKIQPSEIGDDFASNPIGTGPYRVDTLTSGVSHRLVANPDYFRGAPGLEAIEYVYLPDEDARATALRSGGVDMIDYAPWRHLESLEQDGFQLVFNNSALGVVLGFNVSVPPFDDPRVRQAISYAIDRDALVANVMFGYGAAITGGWIPEGSEGFAPELMGRFDRDVERARQLLEEAGALDIDEVPTLLTSSTFAFQQDIATIIQANLAEIGFDVNVDAVEQATYVDRRAAGAFSMQTLTERGVNPSMAFRTYLTDGPGNFGGYASEQADALIAEASSTLELPDREAVLLELQELLLDEMPVAPLIWRAQADALAPTVTSYPSQVGYRCNGEQMEGVRIG